MKRLIAAAIAMMAMAQALSGVDERSTHTKALRRLFCGRCPILDYARIIVFSQPAVSYSSPTLDQLTTFQNEAM